MIERTAEKELRNISKQYKAIAVVGPRQSGKTTLVRQVFANKPYINLENPDVRSFALEDPKGFLNQYKEGAIFDEAQRAPQLFSYLQQMLDESKVLSKFIITGSNNFLLQQSITQSLAGRVGYINLMPFSISELGKAKPQNLLELMYKGFYPPLYDKDFEVGKWFSNYIRTYVERDVRQLKNIDNLLIFERFLRLCASRVGQLLNKNSLAIEVGVDNKTIESWIGVLEASFIVYRLKPHHKNFNKRLVKMPKLYFYDVGLVCSLLGIQNPEQLDLHPLKGSLFENMVVMDVLKYRYNRGLSDNLYFWRNNTGNEIDLLLDNGINLLPLEIKMGHTVTKDYFKGIAYWNRLSDSKGGYVVYAGDEYQKRSNGIEVVSFHKITEYLNN
ncbi:ATP-binding protein [Croceitalea marina]|uniref:ATP-binding protein n=1 Tax=Croceitalea marina TaxID=1775166 RepID=A0ABW5MZS4_9FLAO